MKTYGRDQILQFLAEIDGLLGESVAMEIIGGAAALLAYGAQTATKDIDCFACETTPTAGRSACQPHSARLTLRP